jgi:hypothetical protein
LLVAEARDIVFISAEVVVLVVDSGKCELAMCSTCLQYVIALLELVAAKLIIDDLPNNVV